MSMHCFHSNRERKKLLRTEEKERMKRGKSTVLQVANTVLSDLL